MIKKLFLDLNNFKANLGSVERGDSIELNIKLLDSEDYSRSKFRVLGAKADGKYVEQIEGINLEEKDLKIVLEDQFINCEGIVKLELNVVSGETEITTKEFYFFVSNTMNGEIVESSDSVPTLEKVSKYVDYAVNNLDALKEASADITIINSEFKENEIKRKANELLRERSEKERVRLESIRTTEEADRIKAEAERKEAENNRKVAESNRKLAENTRKTNEAARVEAELNRQSLFEENEEIRNENENLRIEAEKERKLTFSNNNKFESERVEAEKLRAIAEDKRVTAEKARANAEEERIKAETRRENTYTDFNDSEVERKNNEANRVRAEAERVNAESGRNELFNTNEEKRNSTFIESERTRERAFNEAQSNRNEAYEESERVREEAFKVSEAARNESEEERVAAEVLRVEAEKLRVAGEENRNNTFTQSEEERKGVFEEAENARKVAESKRVKAESSRGETEKLRVTAETGRVEAESLRVTAEEERVAAETKRDKKIKELENKIDNIGNNSSNEEIVQARSATTGEVFESLDERIDHEVDRLNKKIDVTMLQQEDKENHVIENTVDGMTTDMVIKGRTLQNLFTTSINNLALSDVSLDGNTFIVNPVNNRYPSMYDKNSKYKENTNYTVILDILENTLQSTSTSMTLILGNAKTESVLGSTIYRFDVSNGKKGRFIQNVKTIPDFSILTRNLGLKMYMGNNYTGGKLKFNIMVIETSMLSTKQIPSYFSGIKSFGESEQEGDKYKISILSNGKNLFNHDELTNGEIVTFNNKRCFKYKDDATNFTLDIKGEENKQYTISIKMYRDESQETKRLNIQFVYSDGTFKTYNLDHDTLREFTTESAKTLAKIKGAYNHSLNAYIDLECTQLEEGSIKTTYEPYKQDKKDILIKSPLREWDSMYEDNGQVKVDRYTSVIDFSNLIINVSEVSERPDAQSTNWFQTNFIPQLKNAKKNTLNFNNKYVGVDAETAWKDKNDFECLSVAVQEGGVRIQGRVKKGATIEQLNEKLRGLIIYYQLATPTVEVVENCVDIDLKTFNEKTYVSFENAMSGTSSFKAPVDSATTIARLNRENRALEEENKTLRQDFESTTLVLTDSDLELVKQNVDIDFRLMEVEFALDIPQSTLSSNINFKKKGEVKSMARSPYEMMKIVILSGDYDKEDYMYKVGKYYERGRMTKEEHDELMSLMTADEVISK